MSVVLYSYRIGSRFSAFIACVQQHHVRKITTNTIAYCVGSMFVDPRLPRTRYLVSGTEE